MQTRWGSATAFAPSPAAPPYPPHRSDRRGRLGRAGTLGLAAFVVWMAGSRVVLGASAARPPFILVGWSTLLDTLELRGHALAAFRLTLAGLWVAVPLWAVTDGFRRGPGWLPAASLAVGLAGLAAAGPVLFTVAVLALNVAMWTVAIVVGLLLFLALLWRALTAPFRRW